MSCPLYKSMKSRGTSLYVFPSAAFDMNSYFQHTTKLSFNKFALLNFPVSSGSTLDIHHSDTGVGGFYNFAPDDTSGQFSVDLIESLRNYIANQDSVIHESRLNINTDFYNFRQKKSPTELIFWKWCKKMNLIDFEPAEHKIDWDKNLPEFGNPNVSTNLNTNYFQKYLWKERLPNIYTITDILADSPTGATITIGSFVKYRDGDTITISGSTVITNQTYTVSNVLASTTGSTFIIPCSSIALSGTFGTSQLLYSRFVQYIGEIGADASIKASHHFFREITAMIPHHAGQTPCVLFETLYNENYKPNLELPMLPAEIQVEIMGAENLNSPIRTNPGDYPGSFYGYYDTVDKTYKMSDGDQLRYQGDYFGIQLNTNVGLQSESYVEALNDFDSTLMDGIAVDFNTVHYYQMNHNGNFVNSFEQFNSISTDGVAPSDFEFNAILWYYDVIDETTGERTTNLYGIEFLGSPDDSFYGCTVGGYKIPSTRKLVSNGVQDGTSYIYNLDLNHEVDNNVIPLEYDPTTIYNDFSFSLYNKIMNINARMYENFQTVISAFTWYNEELSSVRSLVYSQTDIEVLKSQMTNMANLLTLYSTMQIVNSDTITSEVDETGAYPMLRLNTVRSEYIDAQIVNSSDILTYNSTTSGLSYNIIVPAHSKKLLTINNNEYSVDNTVAYANFGTELKYLQSVDIYIKPTLSDKTNFISLATPFLNVDGTLTAQTLLFTQMPNQYIAYDAIVPTASTYNAIHYMNNNIELISSKTGIATGTTTVFTFLTNNIFSGYEAIYIDNFMLMDASGNTFDYSGIYDDFTTGVTTVTVNVDTTNYTVVSSVIKVSYYRGLKYTITRVNSAGDTVAERYQIDKIIL